MFDLLRSTSRIIAYRMNVRSAQLAQVLLVMIVVLVVLPVRALDLSDMNFIYDEDFTGESSFPTIPETDTRGLGGLLPTMVGNGPPASPVLVSGAAVSSLVHASGTQLLEHQGVLGELPFAGSVAIRGSYSSYASAIEGSGYTVVQATLGSSLNALQNVLVRAQLVHVKDAFGVPGEFFLFQIIELEIATSVFDTSSSIVLSPTAISLLFSGDPFEMDLRIDRDTLQASATLTIGVETFATTLELQSAGVQTGTAGFLLSAELANCDWLASCTDLGGDDSHGVNFDRVEVFVSELDTRQEIEYALDSDWIYEEEYPGTLLLSDAPVGIFATVDTPSGVDGGGLGASIHDLPEFTFDNDGVVELDYSSLTSTITSLASLDLCLELEFFDSDYSGYEMAMGISQSGGSRYFETWFAKDLGFDDYYEVSIPEGLSIEEGVLGLYYHDGYVSPYFKDADGDVFSPFNSDWDVSGIVGMHGFSVDNDFEADTLGGGTVVASINLEKVTYGVPEPSPVLLQSVALLCVGAIATRRRKR